LRFYRIACPALLAFLSLDAPYGQPQSGTIRFGIRNDVSTLNPFVNTAAQDHDLRTLVYEPLLLEDRNYQIRPYLAEAWEISKDGQVYTFSLRKGVPFHDGRALASDDVRWSIEYGQNPKNPAYGGQELQTIASVEILDPHRIRLTLREPMASFLSLMTTLQTLPILPRESLATGERPQAFPPGTGPYRFEHWKPGQELILARFPRYWQRGLPKIEQLEIKIVTDPEARFLALRAGEFDLIEKMPPQHVSKIQKGEVGDVKIAIADGAGLQGIVFNTRKPPFDNAKMRQMVAYAVDPKEILKGAYWGVGSVINQKMFPGSAWYFPIPGRRRDLAKARLLLKEAGYGPGFRVRLSGGQQAEKELVIVQSQLREAGVEVEIQLRDPPTHRVSIRKGEFEFATTGANAFLDPDQNYFDYFHTEAGEGGGGRNNARYSNAQVDRLLEEGRRTLDLQKRRKIYREFVELIHEEVPVLYYLISPNVFAHRSNLKGFETRGQGRFFSGDMGIPLAYLER
jgi:peptide/nickel transport system substrate-binding protein